MFKNSSAQYQEKKLKKGIKIFLKQKKRSNYMVVNITKISQKMAVYRNRLCIEKNNIE